MAVATADAFRNIRIIQPTVPEATITTVAAEVVGDTVSITAGLGITITADPETDTLVISNTGNGTGAYTEISDTNANSTFYPLFSRPFLPTDINPLDVPPSYQLDAIYVDNTTNPMTYNPSTGTLTAVNFVGSVTGNLTGNADTVTNGVYTNGSYSDPSWLTISATKVGLGNVTNESKATMFSSPTFTGTVSGVTATMVGLGNVTNESKSTMFSSPTFTGTVSGVTATMVGLGNVTNESKATMFSSPTFTGTVSGVTATMVGLGNVTNESKATMFSSPTFTGTVSGVTATMVGLGNVTNESKATMFTDPTFSNTTNMSKALVGSSANFTRFPSATVAISTTNFGIQQNETATNIGLIAEGVGVNAGNYGVGLYGVGYSSGDARGTGVTGEAHVSTTSDSASAIGVRGYSNDTHASGLNVGLYADASGSSIGNYGLYINAGDINTTNVSPIWLLRDNQTAALSFDAAGKTGILKIVTTDTAEGVTMSGTLNVTGAITGTVSKATNLVGGNNTTQLGAIGYQSNVDTTTLLAPNTTTTKKFLRQTGDGTNGAVPAWDTATATDVGLGNVTNESKATMFTSPTFTGTVTLPTGSNSAAPVKLVSGTSLSSPQAGAIEYDGVAMYVTPDTTMGRSFVVSENIYRLSGNYAPTVPGDALASTGTGFNLVAGGVYEIEFKLWLSVSINSNLQFAFVNTQAPVNMSLWSLFSASSGSAFINVAAAQTGTSINVMTTGGQTPLAASGTYLLECKAMLEANASNASNVRLRLTTSGGGAVLTILRGSYMTVRRVPGNTGTFAT